jgi:hypothetical protein
MSNVSRTSNKIADAPADGRKYWIAFSYVTAAGKGFVCVLAVYTVVTVALFILFHFGLDTDRISVPKSSTIDWKDSPPAALGGEK